MDICSSWLSVGVLGSPKPTSSKHGLEGKKTGKHQSAKASGRVGDVVLAWTIWVLGHAGFGLYSL
jgi:hypothetical protein